MSEALPIEPSDRGLAADWLVEVNGGRDAESDAVRAGGNDGHELVQIFAQRRIAAETWKALA